MKLKLFVIALKRPDRTLQQQKKYLKGNEEKRFVVYFLSFSFIPMQSTLLSLFSNITTLAQ